MSVAEPRLHGCRSMTAPLRRVLLRPPVPEDLAFWRDYGWRAEPDPVAIAREHKALCELLAGAGAEVVLAEARVDGDPDAIYVYDPALIGDDGAVLLRPGKIRRRGETEPLGVDLERAGVPIAGRLGEPALAEGGDLIRLDERTLLVGLGYRTNDVGANALPELTGLDVTTFDLPHWHGEGEVMHLLSLLSPLAEDLVVAYPPLLPTRLAQLLADRGIQIVAVPDEEFASIGANVLALAPRVGLVVAGNPETRRRLERVGVEVLVYEGTELSKGVGGPTCLTCPLLRG
ncbi:MAG TPA: arginine deiminase family protein [Gaiellaceae bacterium]|nr:arginine deiminase family protein [Gaiellaceae bacterium]